MVEVRLGQEGGVVPAPAPGHTTKSQVLPVAPVALDLLNVRFEYIAQDIVVIR
ncbi:hypothetical protein [Streptomyces sp. NPDC006012]|uniref:hypothetical protein n=1 Tax=Streptomyces sp. NPDC006012 TaxID=3364739 RepID=UPI0036A601D7